MDWQDWLLASVLLALWLIREYTLLCAVRRPIDVHVHIVEGEDGGGEELDDDVLPPKRATVDEATRFN